MPRTGIRRSFDTTAWASSWASTEAKNSTVVITARTVARPFVMPGKTERSLNAVHWLRTSNTAMTPHDGSTKTSTPAMRPMCHPLRTPLASQVGRGDLRCRLSAGRSHPLRMRVDVAPRSPNEPDHGHPQRVSGLDGQARRRGDGGDDRDPR